MPLSRWFVGEAEQSRNPQHVFFAAAAPELRTKLDVLKVVAEVRRVPFDLSQGAHLARSDDLVLVKEKDGDPCGSDEFVELSSVGSKLSLRVAVRR